MTVDMEGVRMFKAKNLEKGEHISGIEGLRRKLTGFLETTIPY